MSAISCESLATMFNSPDLRCSAIYYLRTSSAMSLSLSLEDCSASFFIWRWLFTWFSSSCVNISSFSFSSLSDSLLVNWLDFRRASVYSEDKPRRPLSVFYCDMTISWLPSSTVCSIVSGSSTWAVSVLFRPVTDWSTIWNLDRRGTFWIFIGGWSNATPFN